MTYTTVGVGRGKKQRDGLKVSKSDVLFLSSHGRRKGSHTHVPLSGLVIAAEMEVDACVVITVLKKYVLLM